jgi:hypothetical protein
MADSVRYTEISLQGRLHNQYDVMSSNSNVDLQNCDSVDGKRIHSIRFSVSCRPSNYSLGLVNSCTVHCLALHLYKHFLVTKLNS